MAADAYVALLLAAAQLLGPTQVYAQLWPQQDAPSPWQTLVKALYSRVGGKPVAHTRALGGQWLPPTSCLLPDEPCNLSSGSALTQALLKLQLPLLDAPPAVAHMMATYMPSPPAHVTPAAARKALAALPPAHQNALGVKTDAPHLLQYCMAGVRLDNAHQAAQQLAGLRILPLVDGSLGLIQARPGHGFGGVVYLPNELELGICREKGE